MSMSQKQAVIAAIAAANIDLNTHERDEHGVLKFNSSEKSTIKQLIVDIFMTGEVDLEEEDGPGTKRNREWLGKYVGGLLNNWCRKAPELNGGGKYETRKPGSRTGAGDEQLMMMTELLKVTKDPNDRRSIEAAIAARKLELAPKPVKIDASKLPASLRHLVKSA
jgi:hypothetical protein